MHVLLRASGACEEVSPIKILTTVSPTGLSSFSDCRLQWYWTYPTGLRPIQRQKQLELGKGVHAALAAYYQSRKTNQELRGLGSSKRVPTVDPVAFFEAWADQEIHDLEDQADIAMLAEIRTLGITMLMGYAEEYIGKERLEVLAVELDIEVPLPGTDWTVHAILDAIVRDHDRNQEVFVLEHKTYSQLNVSYLDKDHQFVIEAWCASTLIDEPIAGVLYNGLRKMVPGPKVKNALFERHEIRVGEHQIGVVQKRVREMYKQLTAGRLAIYPEPNPVRCNMCAFKEPCTAYQRGDDHTFMLETMFTKRPEETEESD